MIRQEAEQQTDPLLIPFLEATDESQARDHLDQLVARVTPLVEKITNRSRHEDDFQEAMQQVIKSLWDCKADPAGRSLRNYEHYVSVVTANVRRKRIRDQHPEHKALKDSLRHALKREPRFALWDGRNRETICGLTAWRGRDSAGSERLTRLLDQPLACEGAVLPSGDAQRAGHAELLYAIFAWLNHPVRFNDLVRIVFDLKRIVEFTQISDSAEEGAHPQSELVQSKELSPEEKVRRKELLEKLWAEIEQLIPLQRIAYLLNFTIARASSEISESGRENLSLPALCDR
jgi:DNA-directed RNA polymerase specialized sigma24 family protein